MKAVRGGALRRVNSFAARMRGVSARIEGETARLNAPGFLSARDLKKSNLRVANDVTYLRMLAAIERLKGVIAATATNELRSEKFNPYHDEAGRFTFADGVGIGAITGPGHGLGGAGKPAANNDEVAARLAQARGGGSRTGNLGQFQEATPAQLMRYGIANRNATELVRQVRELDPNWRPGPSIYESIEGAISASEGEAVRAQARLSEILKDAIPKTNPSWGVNRLRKALNGQGYVFEKPTRDPGFQYRNFTTGERVRIMERPQRRYSTESDQKHNNEYYYRYQPGWDKREGAHITIPNKDGSEK